MFLSAGWLPTTRLSRNGVANSRDATLDNRYAAVNKIIGCNGYFPRYFG